MATSADVSTPAARASALSAPRPSAPEEPADNRDDEPERRRHRPLRATAMLLALVVILGGGLFAGWSYTQRQYYVGATDSGQLAVFRGVPGQIAGLDLSSVHSTSEAKLDDLTLAAQEQVKQGIQAKSEPDAVRRLAELTSDDPANPNLKPLCPPSPTASAVSPTAAPTASPLAPAVSASGRPVPTATPAAPTTTPDAVPSDTVPPVDPAGCRSSE